MLDADVTSNYNSKAEHWLCSGWLDGWLGFHQHIGLMAQGLQRSLDATKKVIPVKAPQSSLLVCSLPLHLLTSKVLGSS